MPACAWPILRGMARTTLVPALKAMMAAEGTDRQNDARREAARAIVAERQRHEYLGRPDWDGNSRPYRAAIEQAYRKAGVPTDSENSVLHAGLRYHVRMVTNETAPAADLKALRATKKAREAPVLPVEAPPAVNGSSMPSLLSDALDDPVGLVRFAIRGLEAAKQLKPAGSDAETIRYMLKTLWEAVDGLAAAVDQHDD